MAREFLLLLLKWCHYNDGIPPEKGSVENLPKVVGSKRLNKSESANCVA